MPDEPWRPSLDLALHRNRQAPSHRFVQLATIGLDGRPAVRTVVFRSFDEDDRELAFTTDARSAKCAEIRRAPEVQLCWYFAETREQFRLSGLIRLIGAATTDPRLQKARGDAWRALSDETRVSFSWPAPGEARDPGLPFSSTPPDFRTPLDAFVLMLFSARAVDHLELVGAPQYRRKYALSEDDRWSALEVNP